MAEGTAKADRTKRPVSIAYTVTDGQGNVLPKEAAELHIHAVTRNANTIVDLLGENRDLRIARVELLD